MPPRRRPTKPEQRAEQISRAIGPAERQRDRRAIREEREFNEFLARTGRSATNPYGNESSFPFKSANYVQPDVPGGLTQEGVATLNRQAYDKFKNPFAKRSIFGRDVGGDMLRGKLRSDIRPDTLTRFGRTEAAPSRGGFFSGIANLIPLIGTAMRMNKPAVLPGFDMDARSSVPGYNESKLDQLQRLGPKFERENNVGLQTTGVPSASGNIEESVIQKAAPENFETDAGDFFRQQYQFSEAPQINPDNQLAVNFSNRDGPYSLTDLILGAPGLGDQARNDFDEEFRKNYASDGQGGYTPINRATRQNLSGIADVAARLYGLKPLVDAPLGDNSYLTIEGRMLGGEPEGGIYFTKKF